MNSLAVITGATGGIGGAIAEALCAQGYSVCLVGRDQQKLTSMHAELASCHTGASVYSFNCDITESLQRESLVQSVMAIKEPLALWVNTAGINQFGLFEGQDEQVIMDQLAVNATAPMLLTKTVICAVDKAKPLQIINVGSTFGTIGYAGFVAYSASKFALRGFSEALGRELSDTAIQICYFAPRATKTAINAPNVVAMNQALKVVMDEPPIVAQAFIRFLQSRAAIGYVGFPETFFARINSLLPSVVSKALKKQLPTIKAYAVQHQG